MAMYCGIDLHSTKSWVVILDDDLKVVREASGPRSIETAGVSGAKEDVVSALHAWFVRVSDRHPDELECGEEVDGRGRREVRGRPGGRARDHISAGACECNDRPDQHGREKGVEPCQIEGGVCSATDRVGDWQDPGVDHHVRGRRHLAVSGGGQFRVVLPVGEDSPTECGQEKGLGQPENGNPYLSWAFSEAAHHAVRPHEQARRYFQRKRSKTNGIIAIRALAHKLARASYHVMRDQVDFDSAKLFG
jgi:hypothetical protein